jgi:hypothetical protein
MSITQDTEAFHSGVSLKAQCLSFDSSPLCIVKSPVSSELMRFYHFLY